MRVARCEGVAHHSANCTGRMMSHESHMTQTSVPARPCSSGGLVLLAGTAVRRCSCCRQRHDTSHSPFSAGLVPRLQPHSVQLRTSSGRHLVPGTCCIIITSHVSTSTAGKQTVMYLVCLTHEVDKPRSTMAPVHQPIAVGLR